MVFVDRPPALLDADAVLADNRNGAFVGTRQLIAHGHRRIAFLGDLRTITTARERHAGYVDALLAARIVPAERDERHDLHTIERAEAAALEILAAPDRPTAMFTSQNLVTIGAIHALRQLNLQHRIALVGFDDFPMADLLEPGVSVVAQDPSEMGRLAAEVLFRRLDGDVSPTTQRVVDTRFVARGSGEIRPTDPTG